MKKSTIYLLLSILIFTIFIWFAITFPDRYGVMSCIFCFATLFFFASTDDDSKCTDKHIESIDESDFH